MLVPKGLLILSAVASLIDRPSSKDDVLYSWRYC